MKNSIYSVFINTTSLCLLSIVFLLAACADSNNQNVRKKKDETNSNAQSQKTLNIDYPTGSLLPNSILTSKVPTLFNVGRLTDNVYGMLLGPSLPSNKSYNFEPIGVYTFTRDTTELAFILCLADEVEDNLIKANNYNSWSLNEIQYKNLIASWFKTNCELNTCSEMEWANDLKALRILETIK